MSATVRNLEQERGKAHLAHDRSIQKLKKVVDNRAPNQRAFKAVKEACEADFDVLMEKHVAYVLKLNQKLEDVVHTTWIRERTEAHDAAIDQAELVLGQISLVDGQVVPVDDTGPKLEDLQSSFDIAKIRVEAALAQLNIESDKPTLNTQQYEALMQSAESVRRDLLGGIRTASKEIEDLTVDNTQKQAAKDAHVTFFTTNVPSVERVILKIQGKKPEGNIVLGAAAPGGAHAGGAAGGARAPAPALSRPKMEAIAHPTFDGRMINYTKFKHKYNALVKEHYDPQTELEILEKALPAQVKDRLSTVDKSPGQIWVQLEEIYGNPKIILKETMKELYSLDAKVLGEAFMTKFAVTLTDVEALLTLEGQIAHLNHPMQVEALEDMLPMKEAEEFVKRNPNYEGGEFTVLEFGQRR